MADDDGTPNKVFVSETQSISEAQSNSGGTSIVTSASEISNDGAKENDSFTNSASRNWSNSGSLTSSGMTITPCTKSSPADCQDNVESSGSSVTISKNIVHQKFTSDHTTPTKEGKIPSIGDFLNTLILGFIFHVFVYVIVRDFSPMFHVFM